MTIKTINGLPVIEPNWSVPAHIKAYSTTRLGGFSSVPIDGLNLALSVEDDRDDVIKNRARLMEALNLPEPPRWISQTHSTIVHDASALEAICEGDALFTTKPNQVCAILTADCLPIILTNEAGTFVSAIHAGWRGLLNGIIENTLSACHHMDDTMIAWLAPAISQKAFEVGPEVREAFMAHNPHYGDFFIDSERANHFYADLYSIAREKLKAFGVKAHNIFGGDYCTHSSPDLFFSYRRDGKTSGRQATLIWMAS